MPIKDSILNFPTQFDYTPEIVNGNKLKKAKKFVVVGMGGSHLAADLLKILNPSIDLVVHKNYGLPILSDLKDRLIILSSYSGNTEEVIDAFNQARRMKLKMVVIALGGKLLELAEANNITYIQLPAMSLQPRMALGLSLVALLKAIGDKNLLAKINTMSKALNPAVLETRGKNIAERLKGFVPIIYSSEMNLPLAYNWKIKFNENSKVPAFCNAIPELNHNEMQSFDIQESTKELSKNLYFIILRDNADDPRILRRMEILEKLYQSRGLKIETIQIEGHNVFQKVFNTIILGDWTAYHTAVIYGLDPETVPMVEEFKRLMRP